MFLWQLYSDKMVFSPKLCVVLSQVKDKYDCCRWQRCTGTSNKYRIKSQGTQKLWRKKIFIKVFSSDYFKEMLHWDSDSVYIAQCEDSVDQLSKCNSSDHSLVQKGTSSLNILQIYAPTCFAMSKFCFLACDQIMVLQEKKCLCGKQLVYSLSFGKMKHEKNLQDLLWLFVFRPAWLIAGWSQTEDPLKKKMIRMVLGYFFFLYYAVWMMMNLYEIKRKHI